MKKLLAMLLTVAMILSMAVIVSADQIVTVVEYDFENDSQIDNWEHHWGRGQLSLSQGHLHTEKTDQNIMFTTFTKLSQTLKAGVTYTVSADIILCSNTYLNGADRVTITEDDTVSFRMGLRTELDGDNVEIIGSNVTVKPSDLETVAFDYTPSQDMTNLLLCFNMSGSDWKYNGVSYCVDNVSITYTESTTTPEVTPNFQGNGVVFTNDPGIRINFEIECVEAYTATSLSIKLFDANGNFLAEGSRNPNRVESDGLLHFGTILTGHVMMKPSTVDENPGWLQTAWTLDGSNPPAYAELWVDGVKVDTTGIDEYDWVSSEANGYEYAGNIPTTETPANTGYFSTGDDTHAIIIGDAVITSYHEFNANGDCIYCGYHKDLEEDEVLIETPVESTEEEVDTDDTDEVEEPTETDENPTTGIALAVVPMMVAAAAVVASKRR